ncbi:tRNA (adenosine(37)-N6)-threonylcarbamoyltransferase complex ATPase subunit type 1 TsaE [Methylocaldum sp.]|uniref:tRNA (adenosine(37)-N6)-threonylcarbamoyltransferase complex ATPase subunit type 1 TsaE n=1 Tax=Methylocaldum sp. TaxID=1969727 RepID=UPI002D48DF05|nr:tRNA (adenosine(37)-N6)-threonylcarbamoyltransferase complex ATPase subunit type 1 TsaE [Methylocaldum sp.]HYE35324.1 tRNA (adenosine(37)-N6)-threonylcarbamoyltransferase complex ATPase subunit type 1 TsaE [Methylocaldum sp.]
MKLTLRDEAETLAFAGRVYRAMPFGGVVFLRGNLGAGKTTFVRGWLRAAGFSGPVKSPTFTLVEEYSLEDRIVYHFDLYRLNDPEELEWMGFRDYLRPNAVCFIEWPERGEGMLPQADLEINLEIAGTGRIAEIMAGTERGREVLVHMQPE